MVHIVSLFSSHRYNVDHDFMCKMYQFLLTSKIPLSAFIMVAIAIDRYFSICHPLKRIITVVSAKFIVLVLGFISAILGVITSLFYGVEVEITRVDGRQLARYNVSEDKVRIMDRVLLMSKNSDLYTNEVVRERLNVVSMAKNYTLIWNDNVSLPTIKEIMFTGKCFEAKIILSHDIFSPYQQFYSALFALCLLLVIILYSLIFRFVRALRHKKLKQKLAVRSYINEENIILNTIGKTTHQDDHASIESTGIKNNSSTLTAVHIVTSLKSGSLEANGKLTNSLLKDTSFEACGNRIFTDSVPNCKSFGEKRNTTDSALHVTSFEDKTTSDTYLSSPKTFEKNRRHQLSKSFSYLSCSLENESTANTINLSTSNSFPNILDPPAKTETLHTFLKTNGTVDKHDQPTVVLHKDSGCSGRSNGRQEKYRWYKKRDSVKRYKGEHLSSPRTYGKRRSRENETERLREETRRANMRTAMGLFVVTLVFVIAFVPSFFMAHRIIPYQQLVFYMYFSYNVANPFIYAFMNPIFKSYMRKLLG